MEKNKESFVNVDIDSLKNKLNESISLLNQISEIDDKLNDLGIKIKYDFQDINFIILRK